MFSYKEYSLVLTNDLPRKQNENFLQHLDNLQSEVSKYL